MDIRVAIVGASGYAGAELCAILARHPNARIVALFSSPSGQRVGWDDLHPSLAGTTGPAAEPFDLSTLLSAAPDLVFLATPNETSAEIAPQLLFREIRVIDLSGAFRLADPADYPRWYGFEHPAPTLLPRAVYGLTEHCNGELAAAPLVANPGCYATSVLLAVKPLLDLIAPDQPIICDSKSGISGAGKRAGIDYSFTELAGNFKAYGVTGHRHLPEIRQALDLDETRDLVFVPHLLPTPRGILSTIYATLAERLDRDAIVNRFASAYAHSPFVRVRTSRLPQLRDVVGTPRCEIGFELIDGGRRAVLVSVLDNLLKGAASQAVQNFNRMFDLDEREGLV